MDAKEIIQKLKSKFKDDLYDIREDKHTYGLKKNKTIAYWLKVKKQSFKKVVEELCRLNYPFLSVISGSDHGKEIELIYHFYINYGSKLKEEGINLSVFLQKNIPNLPTITDLIPGAILSELEKQEMLGVNIEGISKQKAFLPEKHPKAKFPWRKS